ncbi:MAG: NADP-dependent phosphogluconate dehydrogenase [Planctomycetota bacterium]
MTTTQTNPRPPALAVFPTADGAVDALAARVAHLAHAAIEARGTFRVALAGGSTPARLHAALAATDAIDAALWARFEVFFGDERCVPADAPESNARMAREALLDRVPIPAERVHAIDGTAAPEDAARAYHEALGDAPLDLVLLGMGDDGHTASLFPGGAELDARDARAVASRSPKAPHDRVTLTLPAIESAREVAFLALGGSKREALKRVLDGSRDPVGEATLPAARIRSSAGRVRWFVDRDAAPAEVPAEHLADFGMIGLAVMGRNLALNVRDRGFEVAGWNREPDLTERAVRESEGAILDAASLGELVATLERPRRIMMMIQAGRPVDLVLDGLVPLLDQGDVVIDGGNSWFEDTRRREARLAEAGLRFVGVGVSGGEEGARNGPSLMPGGDAEAYERIRPVLEAIAARTDHGACVTHVGTDGAGHFVKMVHNGIEYADMQFIAEAYHVLSGLVGQTPPEHAETFERWNRGPLESFLVEITAQIFRVPDPDGGWLVDRVLDRAGQKGTGRWTAQVALDLGVSIPSIAAAIDARVLSSEKERRVRLAPLLDGGAPDGREQAVSVEEVESALFAAKVGAYAQGMDLILAGARAHGWSVDPREIARIWTGGCIIRARFLETMMAAYERDPGLENLMADEAIRGALADRSAAWRRVVGAAVASGIPVPGMAASLAYYDALRTERLPQNLVQAQRDAFGAHTYRRTDDPDGPPVHSDWLG